ncbi:MAG: glycosyltransferase family 2 protein [Janthinobacterium lividum]
MKKISICTVSMNRLFHIRETLPANIKDNIEYSNIEYILLDYNSSDGLSNWIKCQMMEHINSGLLKYFRISTPTYFDRCHSRNLACKLASGEIIALVDADNYMGKGYAEWLANVFQSEGDDSVLTNIGSESIMFRDQGGKCAFHANHFLNARGFDEMMNGYGFEDVDFIQRLVQVGGKRMPIQTMEFFKFIGHSDVERICNEHLMNNVVSMYTLLSKNLGKQKELQILYLFDDNRFMHVTFLFKSELETKFYASHRGWLIKPNGRRLGSYRLSEAFLDLTYDETDTQVQFSADEAGNLLMTNDNDKKWLLVPMNIEAYSEYNLLYTECWNRSVYYSNTKGNSTVNPDGFGKGEVVLNFTESLIIT